MGHGSPEIGRLRRFGIPTGLGVDTVAAVPGDMFAVMRADVVVLDTNLPNLAPMLDAVGAVATAAGVRNVDTVIVGGEVVKRGGRLVGVDLPRVLGLARRSGERLVRAAA